LTIHLSGNEKQLHEIVLASQFCSPRLSPYRNEFAEERRLVTAEIDRLCREDIFAENYGQNSETVRDLLTTEDYVGLCLLVAIQLLSKDESGFANNFLTVVRDGAVIPANHDQATRHLACCFLQLGEAETAFAIATDLASRSPDVVGFQLLVVQILASIPERHDEAIERASALRARYSLSAEQESQLAAVETGLGTA
jgi:hypothetical protein